MSAATAVSAPLARPRIALLGACIRANPRLTFIPFHSLSDQERSGFGSLARDPALQGIVRDEHGAIKVLQQAGPVQLGIEFIQGYFVNAPEDVTMSGDR